MGVEGLLLNQNLLQSINKWEGHQHQKEIFLKETLEIKRLSITID